MVNKMTKVTANKKTASTKKNGKVKSNKALVAVKNAAIQLNTTEEKATLALYEAVRSNERALIPFLSKQDQAEHNVTDEEIQATMAAIEGELILASESNPVIDDDTLFIAHEGIDLAIDSLEAMRASIDATRAEFQAQKQQHVEHGHEGYNCVRNPIVNCDNRDKILASIGLKLSKQAANLLTSWVPWDIYIALWKREEKKNQKMLNDIASLASILAKDGAVRSDYPTRYITNAFKKFRDQERPLTAFIGNENSNPPVYGSVTGAAISDGSNKMRALIAAGLIEIKGSYQFIKGTRIVDSKRSNCLYSVNADKAREYGLVS